MIDGCQACWNASWNPKVWWRKNVFLSIIGIVMPATWGYYFTEADGEKDPEPLERKVKNLYEANVNPLRVGRNPLQSWATNSNSHEEGAESLVVCHAVGSWAYKRLELMIVCLMWWCKTSFWWCNPLWGQTYYILEVRNWDILILSGTVTF